MTIVNIDITGVASSVGPLDRVIFYAPEVRARVGSGLVSTREETIQLVDGKASVNMEPGPVYVRFQVQGLTDTKEKFGIVPDSGEVSLDDVIQLKFNWTPPIVDVALQQIIDQMNYSVDHINDLIDDELGSVVRSAEAAALSASQSATQADIKATSAESAAGNAIDRVEALEAMSGLSPESPVDGQTANLITQPDTLTRAALTAANADLMTATSDTLPTGDDLITGEGWTLGEGWTGTLADGFTHTPTGGGALEWALPALVPSVAYLLTVTVEGYAVNNNFPGDLSMDIAGESLHPIYRGSGNTTQEYQRAFYPKNSDPLSITVKASTSARVTAVELVRVLGNIPATATWRDPQGEPSIELRTNGHKSVFLGLDAGRRHQGDTSVGIGADALRDDVTGFFNVAVGMAALRASRRVSRNVAVGYQSLAENVGGDRNVAVGPFAGHRIWTGNENTLLGVDTLWQSHTASRNIAVGLYAMAQADSSDQIAIGNYALHSAKSGENNIAIGAHSMYQTSAGTGNVAVGRAALNRNTGDANVAIGTLASYNTTGSYNVAIGDGALHASTGSTASDTVAIGRNAGRAVTTANRNTLVGYSSGYKITTGNSNTVLGHLSGKSLNTGANNIVIGYEAGSALSAGNENIIIGGSARSDNPNASGFINIGDIVYASRSSGNVGIGVEVPAAALHLKASTGNGGNAPIRFTAGPLAPTPVSGNLEFDGSKLYITISGKRQEIALVTPEPEA